MLRKLFNLILGLMLIGLAVLFSYKMANTPETVKVQVTEEKKTEDNAKKAQTAGLTKDEVQQVIKDYIMANPELLVQSLEGLQTKKIAESTKKATEYIKVNKEQIENAESPPILGNPDGDIVMVAFYDYNCAYCRKANEEENEIIAQDKGVKIILRPIPILGEKSVYAAKVALAIHKVSPQNFVAIHNELMKIVEINEANVKAILGKYSIDYSMVENEVNSFSVKQILNKNFDLAKEMGIKGTPSYIINGNFIPGMIPADKLKGFISQLRASSEEGPTPVEEKKLPENTQGGGNGPEQAGQANSPEVIETPKATDESSMQKQSKDSGTDTGKTQNTDSKQGATDKVDSVKNQ